MKYTFLHISDLHYRTNWHEENGLVCKKFFDDLNIQKFNYENLYLIFSGDIVYEGARTELYSDFNSNFTQKLDSAGLTKNKRICTPGNHDISRDVLKPLLSIQKGTLSEMINEQLFNNNLEQNSKSFLHSKFENYIAHEEDFANYTACSSGIGGSGWELSNDVGVFCLNTALCSYAGLSDLAGNPIYDKNKLMIDTRSLHKWISETNYKFRILVMHHPSDWLVEWAKSELDKIISNNFQVVFSGHIHENSTTLYTRGTGKLVHSVAPPLFTKKSELLGYTFLTIDTASDEIEVIYRQWSQTTHNFVAGTSLAGNDSGKILFSPGLIDYLSTEYTPPISFESETLTILEEEFNEATTCYSSMKSIWVDRDLANMPETNSDREDVIMFTQADILHPFRSCIVRAPKQFGLTCLGYYFAQEYYRQSSLKFALVMLDMAEMPNHKQGVIKYIEARLKSLNLDHNKLFGFIIDNWHSDKQTRRALRELKLAHPNKPIMLLESIDDCSQIASAIEMEDDEVVETLYLWALNRSRIRELVALYLQDIDNMDDDLVTKKVIEDIDALNIHRTPLSCLLILKLFEQAFDDSPVNRTEMIGRVLYLLFYQFNKIPKYATRPDLKDCEYALGYFCEWLIRSEKKSFSKNDFYKKVQEYCTTQIIDLDFEFLFSFLATEHIFVRKGVEFEFRFNYWLYFFAAHRMHHDSGFAEFIMADRRYSAFPEIIEFYAGIDRRRTDVVIRLTEDLKKMNADFLRRTGIHAEFNPLKNILWTPTDDSLTTLKREINESMVESALPSIVKDAYADQDYNRARPYNQALATFINESSLIQMVQAMKGAARALRNSDHVTPEAKTELLDEVISCWIRVCQILVILSPVLAHQREAAFEGMGFFLGKCFDDLDPKQRWDSIMTGIVNNVVSWFQDDLFSKKMGALFSNYNRINSGSLGELLVLIVIVKQRPPNWEKEIEQFVLRENKNSFYLNKIFNALRCEYKFGFSTERNRQEMKRLAAISLARHDVGTKTPNKKLIEAAAKVVEEKPLAKKKASWQFINPKRRKKR